MSSEKESTEITGTDEAVDQRESQLSAMYDGELPTAECELVARRLSRDENLRRSWEHYALIGTVMRAEGLAGRRLAPRVAAGLAGDATVPGMAAELPAELSAESLASADSRQATRERAPRMPRWAVPASGLGLAAGVAVVGVFGVLWLGTGNREPVSSASILPPVASRVAEVVIPAADPQRIVAAAAPTSRPVEPEVSTNGEPLSYVTPPVGSGNSSGTLGFGLAGYVGAHSAVSAPMLRHSALSALIGANSAVDIPLPADAGVAVDGQTEKEKSR